MSSGTGPPGPENATPRLDSEAARKIDEDDRQHIVHSQRPDKPDIRRMRREYQLLCEAQAPIERAFWQLEQRKGRLADQMANEGVTQFCRPRQDGQRRQQPFDAAKEPQREPQADKSQGFEELGF
jgi:hypothetical protein